VTVTISFLHPSQNFSYNSTSWNSSRLLDINCGVGLLEGSSASRFFLPNVLKPLDFLPLKLKEDFFSPEGFLKLLRPPTEPEGVFELNFGRILPITRESLDLTAFESVVPAAALRVGFNGFAMDFVFTLDCCMDLVGSIANFGGDGMDEDGGIETTACVDLMSTSVLEVRVVVTIDSTVSNPEIVVVTCWLASQIGTSVSTGVVTVVV